MLDRSPDQRLLKGAPATLQAEILDQDGEIDSAVASATVTITRLDGTALATAQAATVSGGQASYNLTAEQTAAGLDVLTAVWSVDGVARATTYHEIVGRHWFPASALRNIAGVADAQDTPPGDSSNRALIDARTWIETLIEDVTGVAWVPRTALEYHDGCGQDRIVLDHWYPRTLRSLTIDGVAQTVGDWTLDEYSLRRTSGGAIHAANARGIVVRYDHGADAPPADLVDAAKQAAAYWLLYARTSYVSARTVSTSVEGVLTTFARIDEQHRVGLQAIDATILAHRKLRVGIA